MKKLKLITTGFMGQMPIAGVVWQQLHYLVGLQRLGHEVYYVEDTLNPAYNPVNYDWGEDYGYAAQTVERLARKYHFENRWCVYPRNLPGGSCFGLSKAQLLDLYRDADAVLNICGRLELNDDVLQNRCLIYVESDPGVEQIRIDQGQASTLEYLRKHAALFTFGENIGRPEFPVPLHGLEWLPTRQPVVTDLWKCDAPPPAGAVFTSVANLGTGGVKDMEWRGEKYVWNKAFEFFKFAEAPARAGEEFELATTVKEPETRERFFQNRWRFCSPREISIDEDLYRAYLQNSKGEFTVAKDQYVRLNTGWFSDRSACYLACGRPVITQETGFTKLYGGKRGLFAFNTLDEIAEAVREINADYKSHCRAAFEVASEFFEATKVLAALLDRAGI